MCCKTAPRCQASQRLSAYAVTVPRCNDKFGSNAMSQHPQIYVLYLKTRKRTLYQRIGAVRWQRVDSKPAPAVTAGCPSKACMLEPDRTCMHVCHYFATCSNVPTTRLLKAGGSAESSAAPPGITFCFCKYIGSACKSCSPRSAVVALSLLLLIDTSCVSHRVQLQRVCA